MRNLLITLCLMCLVFYSCKKENTNDCEEHPTTEDTLIVPIDTLITEIDSTLMFQQSDFPVAVGNWWRYRVTDLYDDGRTDTITLEITAQIGEGEFYCTIWQDSLEIDSGTILLSADELEYVENGYPQLFQPYFANFELNFPFTENSLWNGGGTDTIRVTSVVDNFVINGVPYGPVYNIERGFYLGGGYSFTQFLMVSPNIGVIHQTVFRVSGGGWHQTFDLIDFHLE